MRACIRCLPCVHRCVPADRQEMSLPQGIAPASALQRSAPVATGSQPNPWQRWFGPPPAELKPSPYDKVPYTNYDLPEVYKGRNLFVAETITGFILEGESWYTQLALPWAQTDQLTVTWNEWHFNRVKAGRVPHEGVSRLVTSSKRQFRTHVQRHGLAFIMEADFFNTAEGDTHFRRNVEGIGQSVQETQEYDTVDALLRSKNHEMMWRQMCGTTAISFEQVLDQEMDLYGAVVKDENRLDLIYEEGKRMMRKQGVTPDMLILWAGARIYLSMAQDPRHEWWRTGPDGRQLFIEGPKALARFRDDTDVFETRDFHVDDDGQPSQINVRRSNVAEYYRMFMTDWRNGDLSGFQTSWRDTGLQDENRERAIQ